MIILMFSTFQLLPISCSELLKFTGNKFLNFLKQIPWQCQKKNSYWEKNLQHLYKWQGPVQILPTSKLFKSYHSTLCKGRISNRKCHIFPDNIIQDSSITAISGTVKRLNKPSLNKTSNIWYKVEYE